MCGNRVNLQEIGNRVWKINLKPNITKQNNVLRGVSHVNNRRLLFQTTKKKFEGLGFQIETVEESGKVRKPHYPVSEIRSARMPTSI